MFRACARLALIPLAWALHLAGPKHVPVKPGIAIDHVPGPERFVVDDGSPGPYHAPGLARRERLAAALQRWCEVVTFNVVMLICAIEFVLVELVIRRGVREGWWSVLGDFLMQLMRGGY